jgi:Glycosyl transferase family 2
VTSFAASSASTVVSQRTVDNPPRADDFHRSVRRPEAAALPYPGVAVVISALDEAATIGAVVSRVPRRILGGDVEVIVVDDGSSDGTAIMALVAGADHVERHRRNRGLAAAFRSGMDAALATGAQVVVHLDGDGQHAPEFIPSLVAPIVSGEADVVVGVRPLTDSRNLSPVRRRGNRLGSWLFGRILRVPISDATSGYRAFSRDALMRLTVVSECTYTLETLIRAARMHLAVREVVVPALSRTSGESRMTRSLGRYIGLAGGQAFRTLLHANPLTVFGGAALAMFAASLGLTTWFLTGYQSGGMHLPALLAALFALGLSIGLFLCGLIADGINSSHRLLEEVLFHLRRVEYEQPRTQGHPHPYPTTARSSGGRDGPDIPIGG